MAVANGEDFKSTMPEDKIVGISVLDRTELPEQLYVLCECGATDGQRRTTTIPVHAKDSPPEMQAVHNWEYEIEPENVLHVRPSLNWKDVFHNSGDWRVVFEEFQTGKQWENPGDLFRALNFLQK